MTDLIKTYDKRNALSSPRHYTLKGSFHNCLFCLLLWFSEKNK